VAITPDKQTIAAAISPYQGCSGCSGWLKTWDVSTGAELQLLQTYNEADAVIGTPDNKFLSISGYSGTRVALWDGRSAPEGAIDITNNEEAIFSAVAFSPDGTQFALGGGSMTARNNNSTSVELRDGETFQVTHVFRDHVGTVQEVAFGPNGEQLAVATNANNITVWNVDMRTVAHTFSLGFTDPINDLIVSPDGSRVAAMYMNTSAFTNAIRVWDLPSGEPMELPFMTEEITIDMAFSPDSSQLLTICCHALLRVWDLKTGAELVNIETGYDAVTSVSVDSVNNRVVVSGTLGEVLRDSPKGFRVWSLDGYHELLSVQTENAPIHLSFSPDGQYIMGQGYFFGVWNADRGDLVFQRNWLDVAYTTEPIYSLDGRYIVMSGYIPTKPSTQHIDCEPYHPCIVYVLDAVAGTIIRQLQAYRVTPTAMAFSPDGMLFASASESDGTLRLWDVTTGEELAVIENTSISAMAFTADGKLLLTTGYDGMIRVWGVRLH
jgi:WD40 repeat protein